MRFWIYLSNVTQSNTECTSELLTWFGDCVCISVRVVEIILNHSTAQVYSAMHYVKEPICACQRHSVVSLTPPH